MSRGVASINEEEEARHNDHTRNRGTPGFTGPLV